MPSRRFPVWRSGTLAIKSEARAKNQVAERGKAFRVTVTQDHQQGKGRKVKTQGIDEISRVSWKNIQSTAYSAGCISDYGVQSIAAVRTDTDHPVFNLNQILVRATKGEFSNKIQLEWPHIKDVDGYKSC